MMQRLLKASSGVMLYWLSLLFLGSLFSGCSNNGIVKSDGKATVIHVAPTGNDTNPGTREKPLATLFAAQQKVRGLPRIGRIIISIADGNYYLSQPLILTPEDSGTPEAPVLWQAAGSHVRLVGGLPLQPRWQKHSDKIWKTTVDKNTPIDQLFVNQKRQILARYPNFGSNAYCYNGAARTSERMKSWKNPETAYIHALHSSAWGSGHILIQRDEKGELFERIVSIDTTTEGNDAWLNESRRFAENVFEELDAPMEWYFDQSAATLYYQPLNPDEISVAKVEAIHNPHVVILEGSEANPLRFITIDGVNFSGAAPTWKQTTDHLPNGGDYVVHRSGALTLRGTEDCIIRNCTFTELGGNAVFLDAYNRRSVVKDCLIQNIGANAISLCGAAESMRGNEFFTVLDETIRRVYQVRNKWVFPEGWYKIPADLTPGPRGNNYPADCRVEGNLITLSGELEKQSAGVLISLSMNNTVSHNTIYNLPRAGICIQDGAWGGHIIEHNDVFDTVKETADHGPFNSWGKDRYWLWADHNGRHNENPAAKTNSLVDAITPTKIRNNRFAHPLGAHSWGIDLDDGSTHYQIINNLGIGCSVKMREGFYRTVENNIFIFSGKNAIARHVSFAKNEDIYRRNIVVNLNDAMVWRGIADNPMEMKETGHNCYFTPGNTPEWKVFGPNNKTLEFCQNKGFELGSIIADPLFIDPKSGNYQVKAESPALALGFKNFSMDSFGVTSKKLKALVPQRTFPVPGELSIQNDPEISATRIALTDFLGGQIKNMTTDAEKSAIGTGEISGVLIETAPANSALAKAGFRVGELIIKANGKKVDSVKSLLEIYRQSETQPLEVQVFDSPVRTLRLPRSAELKQ